MTDERAGQLNEPNLMADIRSEVWEQVNPLGDPGPVIMVTIAVLRHRGLINELGLEILKRDGVIPPVSPDHSKP